MSNRASGRLFFVVVIGIAVAFVAPALLYSQPSLDIQAWNMVWDRFNKIFPAGNGTNIIHALEIPIPATWADPNEEEALADLQYIAGAIPEEAYVIHPSRLTRSLQEMYAEIVLSVELPVQSPEERARFQAAQAKFESARKEFDVKAAEWNQLWKERKVELKDENKPADARARQAFRQEYTGFFNKVIAKMDDAMIDVQRFSSVAELWVSAVRALRTQVGDVQGKVQPGVFKYYGGFPTLKAMANDCALDSSKGWERLSFTSNISAERTRSNAWNGSGGWGGTFFKLDLGGGGTEYNHVITTRDESVTLGFCKMSPIVLRPDESWFKIGLLQAIERGDYKLRQEKLSRDLRGRKIFGPTGLIPRLVKGAIVARNISFEAKIGTTNLDEAKRHIGGSAGISIGPFHLGGDAGQDEFSRNYSAQSGAYGRATDFSLPVIIAIITEPTVDNSPKPPAAKAASTKQGN